MLELHAQVRREAQQALDDARDWGSVDFGHVCEQVLEMEDSPEKARCLARLGGFALWYSHNLRTEEEPRCNISGEPCGPGMCHCSTCKDWFRAQKKPAVQP